MKTLKERLAAAEAAKTKVDEKLAKLRAEDRKLDARRKIIIGGTVLALAEKKNKDGEDWTGWIKKQVRTMKARDRALFVGTPFDPDASLPRVAEEAKPEEG